MHLSAKSTFSDIDALTKAGKIFGGSGGAGGQGERTAKAIYTELSIPVLAELELSLAGRYDHYSDFGNTFNPQLGLRYTPLANLLIRASYGEGFRAPTLADLYRGLKVGIPSQTTHYVMQQWEKK